MELLSILQNFHNLPILEHLKFLATLVFASFKSFLILLEYDIFFHIIILTVCIISYIIAYYFHSKPPNIYLVDFSCYKPPNYCRIPLSSFIEHVHLINYFNKESAEFMSKILNSSGQGPETYLPPPLHYIPPKPAHYDAIEEAKMVIFPMMEDLLLKSNLSSLDIDILIVNCSGLCPSPSLTSLVVNKFKLRPNVKSFNISGMGCSASMIALGLAHNLLLVHQESNAVVLSTEILTTGWYSGNERPKLVINCLFRMGGAAILLSNRKLARKKSKYQVIWTSRAQQAINDWAYKSAFREEDSNGLTGVTLNKDILEAASDMIRAQLIALGSFMLPTWEKLKFVTSIAKKKYWKKSAEIYVPNFKTIIQHFCLPVSGKPVIREIGKGLRLGDRETEAALATLHRFGNQSSSSLLYELAYIEAKERVKKGDRVWMLGMGSGPKCTSIVLECIKPIIGESKKGPWAGSIYKYPALAFNS
ncbi:3-ketoacyl-CoA synthase 5-like [Chenopodium quinoa]|nr:3-ketoacyl-CoA synthase 5-like [Chenopodium quinoa]